MIMPRSGRKSAPAQCERALGRRASHLPAARGRGEAGWPEPVVRDLLLVSGLHDLQPPRSSFLQSEIGLTPEETATWSPLTSVLHPEAHAVLAVGAEETEPFHAQAAAPAAREAISLRW